MMKRISNMMPTLSIIWHHLVNFCSLYLVVRAIVGIFQQSMSLAQILVYLIMGGINLFISYKKGYFRFKPPTQSIRI